MLRPAQLTLPFLLCVLSAHAQNSAQATRAAAPAATTTPMPAQPAAPSAQPGTVTGVPRYRAGMRGPRGTTAPAATADITLTGKGDHTGTGDGTESSTLAVPQIPNAFGVARGTVLRVRLKQPIDSGHAKNGDMIDGVLTAPAGSAPAGSPVKLTVVAAAAAGRMTSAGELSLQVVSINGQTVLSNVITAQGEEGKTILPDDAPARGTEAIFTPDKPIELPAA